MGPDLRSARLEGTSEVAVAHSVDGHATGEVVGRTADLIYPDNVTEPVEFRDEYVCLTLARESEFVFLVEKAIAAEITGHKGAAEIIDGDAGSEILSQSACPH